MKKGWQIKPFAECIAPVQYTRKIQRKDFLEEGDFPIVSQEAEFTNGYWNDSSDVFRVKTPVVVFGAHTQVLKYVDFDFVLGADGVKLLQPKAFLSPRFFSYQRLAVERPSLGYARHYRQLRHRPVTPGLSGSGRGTAKDRRAHRGIARRNPSPGGALRAKAGGAGGVEKVAAAPSLHGSTLMNQNPALFTPLTRLTGGYDHA